jgi:Secretion system C-terminal sorting domain/Fibronectin type III domain
MKKIYLLITALVFITCIKAQTVSFFINAHADDVPLFMSSKLITDIKAGNKVVLITLTAGDEGNGNNSFNGSSIPFYLSCEKGLVYASKFAYDISFNSSIVLTPALQTVNINGHNMAKYVYKNTVNYFLRLPDGGAAGNGYAQTGNVSLQKLHSQAVASLNAVDGSAAYTGWTDLLNTINSIINTENGVNAAYINTPSVNTAYNPSENSDHFYAGLAAQNAVSTFSWAGINEFVGNNSGNLAANLNTSDFLNCSGIFAVYNYSVIENNYTTKFTAANKGYMPMDYFSVLNIPNACSAVTGLNTSGITSGTATLNWAAATGAVGYDVDYKLTGSNIWIIAATNTTATSVNIAGLNAAAVYDYRVRRKCTSSYSAYTAAQFSTLASATCNAPLSLNTNSIGASSVTVLWAAITGATSYQLEYKLNSAPTFTVYNSALASTSANITGLTAGSLYQWRVKTNCSAASSAYSASEFTTAAAPTCATPVNLSTTGITTTSALLSWGAVTGVSNYTVEYKQTSSGTWLILSTALNATTITATGLISNTSYDWRVKANCSNGAISSYSSFAFTTSATAAACNKPVNLYVTNVTSSKCTFNWDVVANVTGYAVQYRLYGSTSWITAASNITATNYTITGLNYYTYYEWRIISNCTNGTTNPSDLYVVLTSCIDFNEPNNTFAQATPMGITAVKSAQITTIADVDFYKFTTTAPQTNFTVTVFDLTQDYNVNLYNSSGQLLGSSANTGVTSEKIVYNTATAGTFYFSVLGVNGSFDSTHCYVYTVNASNTTMSVAAPITATEVQAARYLSSTNSNITKLPEINTGIAKSSIYPQPAADFVNVPYQCEKRSLVTVKINDIKGYTLQQNIANVIAGNNNININLLKLPSGVYVLSLIDGQKITTHKLIIAR